MLYSPGPPFIPGNKKNSVLGIKSGEIRYPWWSNIAMQEKN